MLPAAFPAFVLPPFGPFAVIVKESPLLLILYSIRCFFGVWGFKGGCWFCWFWLCWFGFSIECVREIGWGRFGFAELSTVFGFEAGTEEISSMMSSWFGWAEKWCWIILTSGYFLYVKKFFAWRISNDISIYGGLYKFRCKVGTIEWKAMGVVWTLIYDARF